MANDSDTDLLPVKESSPGVCDKIGLQLVSRYKRDELEDRFMRMYEDNIGLKKIIHSQDQKIKKLGTKLLRVINEGKNHTCYVVGGHDDEKVKMLELERENYALKDKNTVLRQQLASHSRQHMAAHRSPVYVNRVSSSSRLSQRQPSLPNVNEKSYTPPNQHNPTELQLHDAEIHISMLNEQIKDLHNQIEALHKKLELSMDASQQAQVKENIELIKLRRQKKHLETQMRVSEHSQKLLQQDVARLQKENEDALQIIAEKQGSLIDLQAQLDDLSRVQLECHELRGTVADLTAERDILKKRCDEFLKTATDNSRDASTRSQVNMEIAELRQELDKLKNARFPELQNKPTSNLASAGTQTDKRDDAFTGLPGYKPFNILDRLSLIASQSAVTKSSVTPREDKSHANSVEPQAEVGIKTTKDADMQKITSDNAMLRDLLRGQKQLSTNLETQIIRLKQEMRMKEERYTDVFQQRDLFFRLLDKSSSQNGELVTSEVAGTYTKNSPARHSKTDKDETVLTTIPHGSGTFTRPSPVKTVVSSERITNDMQSPLNDSTSSSGNSSAPTPVPRSLATRRNVNEDKNKPLTKKIENIHISISIAWLQLDDNSHIIREETIKALYIDFKIFSQISEDFETPNALPKPSSGSKAIFNFTVDVPWNDKMQKELEVVRASEGNADVLVFNVVSEPPEEDGEEQEVRCLVVGVSSIGLKDFVDSVPEEELLLPVFEEGARGRRCGTLAIKLSVPHCVKELC